MGSIYPRGNKLWLAYVDSDGERKLRPSGFSVGQEVEAKNLLAEVEKQIGASVRLGQTGPVTLRAFAKRWCADRVKEDFVTAKDEKRWVELHILPALGSISLTEMRPRHVRDLVRALKRKKSIKGTVLAPRSVRHVYMVLHRMLHDAVVDEHIAANPCVLKAGELPGKVDVDPEWRAGAVFTREEAEGMISDERIPEDRRMFNALLFLGGLRAGEASALTWRAYDADARPLGRLQVAHSWSTAKQIVKSTKTNRTRQVPVHPTLAKVLATWKLGGFQRMLGHTPEPDDLIIPSREGRHRNVNHMKKRFDQDLARLEHRKRRQHDARRTFITLARVDGARKDVLQLITHGADSSDIMDCYSTLPWPTLCEAVSCLRLDLREGKVLQMPKLAVCE